jgi:integrase
MASIIKIGTSWRAQVRRKGHQPITQTFPTKAAAQQWARGVEADIDNQRHQDSRSLGDATVSKLVDRYMEDMQLEKPFGKNKLAVLKSFKTSLGDVKLADLNEDRLTKYVKDRRTAGAGGVTINIDLTYLGGMLKVAKRLWKMPVDLDAITAARAHMKYMGISTKAKERTRRPTNLEIKQLSDYFDLRSSLPMRDIIAFAIETAMRLEEITRIRWEDLNETDKTIVIRDRKHPTLKEGNDQEVPLLGQAFAIARRQKKKKDDPRIFPYSGDTISTIFPRACNALGIIDLHFHDFRHEGVSRLFEQGYTIEQVALVSGHRDWKMLARYTQLRAKDLHRKET